MNKVDLSTVQVVPLLPDSFDTDREELPDDFEGAVIVRFGKIRNRVR